MKSKECMDALLEKEIKENRIPGAQIGVYSGEETFYEMEYGYPKDSIYRMYSMTKPVTAVAAMVMYQRGKLDLLSPVAEYLPEFGEMEVLTEAGRKSAKRQIQIWDLLNMTSGIVYPDEDLAGREMERQIQKVQERTDTPEAYTTRQVAELIAKAPLAAEPGERWRYGLSADVLGAVIECIDGRELSRFYQEEIFEPLGMEDTSFWVPREKQSRLVTLFYQEEEGGRTILREDESRHLGLGYGMVSPAFVSGGAGLYSTREDYKKFARMLLKKGGLPGGNRLLSEQVFSMFVQNHLTLEQKKTVDFVHMAGYGYGSLMRIHENPRQSGSCSGIGEFGWDGWTGPYCSVDCERDRIFLFMTQVSGYSDWPLIRKMKAVVNTF
ncbi:MAG: beta-lactamase family protein [Lachnospiraceae bacterium]|nr:beta-lactamase family protein [Lachnospiraceae bacterium]